MTKYRIAQLTCPNGVAFYVEYRGWWFWHRAQDIRPVSCGGFPMFYDLVFADLEVARQWIVAQLASQVPCTTTYHSP